MTDGGPGQWGRFLEAELTGVELVTVHALIFGPVNEPSAWIRGRDANPLLLLTDSAVRRVVDDLWMPSMAVYWREVPSVGLETDHGRVLITDLWGGSQYRMLRRTRGGSPLQLGMPLIRVASSIERMGTEHRSSVVVTVAGDDEVVPLLPRARLHAWSSYASASDAGYAWVEEANEYPRAGARSVMREFLRAQ